MQRAQRGEPHLAGDRLNYAIGRQPRPDDRVDTGWQRIRRWQARDLRWKHLRAATATAATTTTAATSATTTTTTTTATTTATRWHHEGRAQKPIARVAAVDAALEQPVVEGPRLDIVGECKRAGRGAGRVEDLHD